MSEQTFLVIYFSLPQKLLLLSYELMTWSSLSRKKVKMKI